MEWILNPETQYSVLNGRDQHLLATYAKIALEQPAKKAKP